MKSIDDGDDNVSEADVTGDSGVGSRAAVRSVKGVRVRVCGVLVGMGTGRVSEVVLRRVSARSSRSKFCRSVRELARDVVAARVLREATFGEQSHYRHQDETGRGRGTGIEGWRGVDSSMSICVCTSLRTLQYSEYTL